MSYAWGDETLSPNKQTDGPYRHESLAVGNPISDVWKFESLHNKTLSFPSFVYRSIFNL